MVTALLGVLKAGGAYLPLDPSHPKSRLDFMLEDSSASVLITPRSWQDDAGPRVTRFHIDDEASVAGLPATNPANAAQSANLAYVMYTSGSTGAPKGIGITHRGITRLVLNTDYVTLGPSDRVAQASNASFDGATFEIWGALLNGACLVGIPNDVLLAPDWLAAHLREQRITTMFVPTALFDVIAAKAAGAFAPLRNVLFGGSAANPKWARAVFEQSRPARLLNVYGPTENTTFSSWHLIEDVREEALTVPIGRPIANTTLHVLDPQMKPVAAGVDGELYLGGDGLARGYVNRPALTAQKFVPDPFGGPGERLYRTGDLARILPDGSVEFVGRIDRQVKIRGFRIEPAEIEAALCRLPGVRQGAIRVDKDPAEGPRLIAYVVFGQGGASDISVLRRLLKTRLPEYMVPSCWIAMDAFPLTPNGKVDYDRLPDSDRSRPELGLDCTLPRTPIEEQAAAIWRELLGVQQISITDNFFELGGSSLLVAQFLFRVRHTWAIDLTWQRFLRDPTLAGVALAVTELQMETQDEEVIGRLLEELNNGIGTGLQKLGTEAG
jgi:amino acid adenylation domain-containing protein